MNQRTINEVMALKEERGKFLINIDSKLRKLTRGCNHKFPDGTPAYHPVLKICRICDEDLDPYLR